MCFMVIAGVAVCGSACFGEGTGRVFYRDVDCSNGADVLSECTKSLVGGQGNCSNHSNDAGVLCGKSCV